MQYLYLILNLGTISIPLLYSIFEKKFHFWQYARHIFLSIVAIAIPFLLWDGVFTEMGVWGFNEAYHLPLTILGMPIEEWLFFICVPYACLFTYEGFKYYFPNFKISIKAVRLISIFLFSLTGVILVLHFGKLYTTINFLWFLFLMGYATKKHINVLQSYLPVFLLILIPFFIVNGILTGSGIQDQVVWYNNAENIGFRLGTIPFEDIFYAFNLLFSIQLVFNKLKASQHAKQRKA